MKQKLLFRYHMLSLLLSLGEIIYFPDAIILSSLSVIDMAGCMVDCVLININQLITWRSD